MFLTGFAATGAVLIALACAAVAFARLTGGRNPPDPTWTPQRVILLATGTAVGIGAPALYRALDVDTATPTWWLKTAHGVLVLGGFLVIIRLVERIRLDMWSDRTLTALLDKALPVLVTAQRRAIGDQGPGADLVSRTRLALKDGRGREALRFAAQVRELIESAGLPEHAAWSEVSRQIAHWEADLLPRNGSKARNRDLPGPEGAPTS
ncbi:hypothetical protein [Kitasatospora sp. NPDC088134]|uniref:hypothetical protein n=1 Tax=Kitasatospora sp. NPDC088134 TaxID=3364071 RepID=UPI00381C5DB8